MNLIGSMIARFLPSLLPGVGAFLNPLVLLAVVAAAGLMFFKGYQLGRGALDDYIGKQAVEAVRIVTLRGQVTERVVTHYVKVAGETQVVTNTIEKEVVRYAETHPGACLDPDWGRLHDAAALNAVPQPPGAADAARGAPEAAAALQTVTGNYTACHRAVDRLDALQLWVREQQKVR